MLKLLSSIFSRLGQHIPATDMLSSDIKIAHPFLRETVELFQFRLYTLDALPCSIKTCMGDTCCYPDVPPVNVILKLIISYRSPVGCRVLRSLFHSIRHVVISAVMSESPSCSQVSCDTTAIEAAQSACHLSLMDRMACLDHILIAILCRLTSRSLSTSIANKWFLDLVSG